MLTEPCNRLSCEPPRKRAALFSALLVAAALAAPLLPAVESSLTAPPGRVVNFSARAQVASGGNVLINGC